MPKRVTASVPAGSGSLNLLTQFAPGYNYVTLTGKITEAPNANLLYDQNQDSPIQYSQALSIGRLFTL